MEGAARASKLTVDGNREARGSLSPSVLHETTDQSRKYQLHQENGVTEALCPPGYDARVGFRPRKSPTVPSLPGLRHEDVTTERMEIRRRNLTITLDSLVGKKGEAFKEKRINIVPYALTEGRRTKV